MCYELAFYSRFFFLLSKTRVSSRRAYPTYPPCTCHAFAAFATLSSRVAAPPRDPIFTKGKCETANLFFIRNVLERAGVDEAQAAQVGAEILIKIKWAQ
jgi:hypothetical protein